MRKAVLAALGGAIVGFASLGLIAPASAADDCSCTARHARILEMYEFLQAEKAQKAAEEAVRAEAEAVAPESDEAETPAETATAAPGDTESGG